MTQPLDAWYGSNPLDPVFRNDPYPGLERLRREQPVHVTPIGVWRLSRYDDCLRLLKEVPAGVRRRDGSFWPPGSEAPPHGNFMLSQDPPAHTRLRRLVSRAFTPRAVERMRSHVEGVVEDCLDRVAERGELDVIADLALPVPSLLICQMLGVPVADRDRFTVWTAQATHSLAGAFAPAEVVQRAEAATRSLADYFEALMAERRDRLGDDLLSALLRAEAEGDRLTPDELVSQAIGLLIAGFETTIGLIGNGLRALLEHPVELAKLRARPELIASAVEECLRFDGPIVLTVRILHADAEFGGITIPADTPVWAMLAAANRDPERFPAPQRFDIERSPNEHLAFGGGSHFCLGAHLARMEAQLAIGGLVKRFAKLELVDVPAEWGLSLFRVPARLPVSFRTC